MMVDKESISNNDIIRDDILGELKECAKRNKRLKSKNNVNNKSRRPICIYIKDEKILKIYSCQRVLTEDYFISHISDKARQWKKHLYNNDKKFVIFYKEDLHEFNNCGVTIENTYTI